jgi:hypothetical protein
MIRAAIAVAALGIALLPVPIARDRAVAPAYDAVWLWAGVRAQPALGSAKRLYLLQGQVEATDPVRYAAQRAAIPRLGNREVWMVVRVETLGWSPAIYDQMLAALGRWRAAGNRVVGVQIDFDARTRHLEDYAVFLRGLRARLPRDCRLGVTGLLDWSANGDPKGLDALAGVVDEAVLQIYQGDHVIPGYQAYLAKLDRLKLPFRIGLLQGGEWRPPAGLEANPWFRGYVTFLRNPVEPRGKE